ncbi:hypothetical protein [Amycolatopsis sp. NPDC059657]|uniref:SecDF P1 head subdomain-containing protein n=1 Tax=Amycolatopsis sp. NPDC059657 TaxID=3346899 RepID=UPI003672DA84
MRLLPLLLLACLLTGCSAEVINAHQPLELRVVAEPGETTLKDKAGTEYHVGPVALVLARFTGIKAGYDQQRGSRVINITLPDEEAAKWGKFTEENLEKRIVMVVGGIVQSVDTIRSPILDGNLQLTGRTLTTAEITQLAKDIKGGS